MALDTPIVAAAGDTLDGLIEVTIRVTAARAAARATLVFATQSLPPGALADPELRLTLTVPDGPPLLTLRPDTITTDLIGGTTTLEGRDLASLLIDQTLSETFANRTASDIATDLAGRHGLTAEVTATTTPVGRLFRSDRALLSLASEWDLLCALADAEAFDLLVAAEMLIFAPLPQSAAISLRRTDCIAVQRTASPSISRAIELTVRSWDPARAAAVTHTATRGQGIARRQHLMRPNLTDADAAALAERTLADLARFERTAVLTMPGETTITTRSTIDLEGVAYRVAALDREWGASGFTQTLELTAP